MLTNNQNEKGIKALDKFVTEMKEQFPNDKDIESKLFYYLEGARLVLTEIDGDENYIDGLIDSLIHKL